MEGVNSIREALRAGRKLYKIWVSREKTRPEVEEILNKAHELGIPVACVERAALDRLVGKKEHQGLLAEAEAYRYAEVDEIIEEAYASHKSPLVVVCDGIQDPGNLGAIIRTAECLGVHGIIIPKDNACPVTPAVSKASAGAVEHMKVARVTNIARTLDMLKDKGFWVVGSDIQGQNVLWGVELTSNLALVIGSEGRGLRRLVKEKCDLLVRIPMRGRIDSLNASVAAALFIYEAVRQQAGI